MNLKTFSQLARRSLIKGVEKKLLFWGFDAKGNVLEEPLPVDGGYLMRGEPYDDPTVPAKWTALRDAVSKKGIETVIEEASYTWFNRIMAIRILAKNGYDRPQLEYEGDSKTPTILVRARRGQTDFLNSAEKSRLTKVLSDYSKEKEAFAILLVGYCEHHQLLKAIFGRLDDYTELLLPDDILEEGGLIQLLNTTDAISDEDYQKVELIGWLYQFYISEKKDEVFASFKKNKKAEAKDIPAATQIFTPNWIVKYMVQNTVGKLWLDLNPDSSLRRDMAYLIDDPEQQQSPIISEAAQLKLLDPAVGSGHILVEGFDLLYAMHMEEYYTPEDAVRHILQDNLFGLDIDTRAVQLACFALLLKSAKYYPEVLKKEWMPQIYAMPEAYLFTRQEILDFLGREGLSYEEELTDALKLMRDAQNLGSTMIIDLSKDGRAFLIKRIKELEKLAQTDFGLQSILNRFRPYIQVMRILTDQYEAVAANPPYLSFKKYNSILINYLIENFSVSYNDLSTVFMELSSKLIKTGGYYSMINQTSWMIKPTFEILRNRFLENRNTEDFASLLYLGPGTFDEINGEVVQSVSFTVSKSPKNRTIFFKLNKEKDSTSKENSFLKRKCKVIEKPTSEFSKLPGNQFGFWLNEDLLKTFESSPISLYGDAKQGLKTGNNPYFIKNWFEISCRKINSKWFPVEKGGDFKKWFGNNDFFLNWENQGYEIKNFFNEEGKLRSRPQNLNYFFTIGATWSTSAGEKPSFRYSGGEFTFESSGSKFFSNSTIYDVHVFLAYLNSYVAKYIIEVFAPGIGISEGAIKALPFITGKLPYDLIRTKAIENVRISKSDWDSRETSWDFEGSPLIRERSLKSAYQIWEEKVTTDFFALHRNEEELNRIFIRIYGLEEELTPEVPLTEITILQEELDEKKLQKLEDRRRETEDLSSLKLPIKREVVMKQLISYAIGISMGRYRLDRPGLHIAHPDPTTEDLKPYKFEPYTIEIDEDGIIPIMGSAGTFADDALQRVKYFLEVIWGADTLTQNLNFLQECLDEDLESYLVKKFWKDHCKTYKNKPIYWLFSSDKGAFQVLAYMHRMNAFTVEKIRSNYLMPHLKHLRTQIDRLEASKEDPRLLDRLQKALTECEAYDLILKDVADKQITFDLDDGVTKNYELFEGVVGKVK
ncbi:BREX-1 system adenine-specific DNA-methyltransferase PglX [Algoriphagus taiwanensis]|uniref:site-specific DNA-methyltransferase (adenine-specific) n=1 Tax=Algoriphagus taiwanensis TaxID=1445656 RepID=A0ABQ6PVW8_9BACT|nr:BREX-1 system adenine-specific DNA-methyltransferase PglX [Algoriphagus taiwanensis]